MGKVHRSRVQGSRWRGVLPVSADRHHVCSQVKHGRLALCGRASARRRPKDHLMPVCPRPHQTLPGPRRQAAPRRQGLRVQPASDHLRRAPGGLRIVHAQPLKRLQGLGDGVYKWPTKASGAVAARFGLPLAPTTHPCKQLRRRNASPLPARPSGVEFPSPWPLLLLVPVRGRRKSIRSLPVAPKTGEARGRHRRGLPAGLPHPPRRAAGSGYHPLQRLVQSAQPGRVGGLRDAGVARAPARAPPQTQTALVPPRHGFTPVALVSVATQRAACALSCCEERRYHLPPTNRQH